MPWDAWFKPGFVIVKCTLTLEGTATDCKIIKALDDAIDRAILDWLSGRRYTPVLYNGRPVRVSYVFNFRFRAR